MGTGVERDKTFDAVLERRLNAENDATQFQKFEILNFAVYGYYPVEQIRVLEDKATLFDPDAVLYVGHPGDADRVVHYLALAVQSGAVLDHQFLSDVARRAGVNAHTPPRLAHRQLQPFGEEILTWVYRQIVAHCNQRGIQAVFILLPMVPESADSEIEKSEVGLARDAGFIVFDLDDVYEGHNRQSLWIAEWDAHPNALGHQLIADRLYRLIRQATNELGLDPQHP
jgi:hypothetical protein